MDKIVTAYLTEECERQAVAQLLKTDLKAIAIDGSKKETTMVDYKFGDALVTC